MKAPIVSVLFAALAFTAFGAQAADHGTTKSRAEVVAELAQAKATGQYTFSEEAYPAPLPQRTELSRAQVESELAQSKADGEYTFGTLDYPPTFDRVGSNKSRDQVRAELAEAKATGHYTFGNLDYPPAPVHG